MMIDRSLTPLLAQSKKSIFLLGPRQTGKSTLFRQHQADLVIDLSREVEYLAFAQNPSELESRIAGSQPKLVFVDEVQRLPSLLNTIQHLIDYHPELRFLLTGSSARKLKRGQANLLPGRIHTFHIGPLSVAELGYQVDEKVALMTGTLPGIYTEDSERDREKTLTTYSATYLKEEIQAEALTRNVEGFARFLSIAAASVTEFLDMTKLASQAQISRQSASRYFEILEETLIVHRVDSFAKSVRKRLVQHPRYFFFDNGVLNGLLKNFTLSADRIGRLFDNLFFSQLMCSAQAKDLDIKVSAYRTSHGAEVDFIVELNREIWAIELKASQNVGAADLSGLKSFALYHQAAHRSCVAYMGSSKKTIDGVDVFPWQELLKVMGL